MSSHPAPRSSAKALLDGWTTISVLAKDLEGERTKADVLTDRVRAIRALAKVDPEADPAVQLEALTAWAIQHSAQIELLTIGRLRMLVGRARGPTMDVSKYRKAVLVRMYRQPEYAPRRNAKRQAAGADDCADTDDDSDDDEDEETGAAAELGACKPLYGADQRTKPTRKRCGLASARRLLPRAR
jgi:hypothetical protein